MLGFPKTRTREEKLLLIYGLLGTMPIVQLLGFTVFTWLTLFMLLFLVMQGRKIEKFNIKTTPYVIFTMFTIISAIVCLFSNMPGMWKTVQIPNIVWQLCYLFIFLFYFNQQNHSKCLHFIKGVYYSAFVHAFWGILQVLAFEVGHISINKLLFYDVLHIEAAEYVQTRGDSIAITGLCWNAGNIAPLMVIGYVFSPSIFTKLFFVGVSLLSGSRTALAGIIVCIFIDICFHVFRKGKKQIKPIYLVGILIIIIVGIVLVLMNGKAIQKVNERIQEMQNTFSPDYLNTQSSSRLHARYWLTIPQVTNWNEPLNNLFGYGINNSGFPFAELYGQYADHAWNVECDFINNLWSFGFVGFGVWYGWYFYQFVKGTKLDKGFCVLFIGLLAEGVTYNVTFNWCLIFLLFVFMQISYSNDFLKKNYIRYRRLKRNAVVRGC